MEKGRKYREATKTNSISIFNISISYNIFRLFDKGRREYETVKFFV